MKFSTVLIFALIGLILFGVFYDNKRAPHLAGSAPSGPISSSSPSRPIGSSSPVAPSSPTLLATVQSILKSVSNSTRSSSSSAASGASPSSGSGPAEPIRADQLLIARGTIMQKTDTGLLLQCSLPIIDTSGTLGAPSHEPPGREAQVLPNKPPPLLSTKSNELVRQGIVNRQQEEQLFGPLTSVDHGIVQPTRIEINQWTADKYLQGMVLLLGYPAEAAFPAGTIKVVVAPASPATWNGAVYQTVTAIFNAAPAPPGSWMWNKSAGAGLESR